MKKKYLILAVFISFWAAKVITLKSSDIDCQLAKQETKIAFLTAQSRMEQAFRQKIILQEQINLQLENSLQRELFSLENTKNELLELKKELENRALEQVLKTGASDRIFKILELLISGATIFDNFYLKEKSPGEHFQ